MKFPKQQTVGWWIEQLRQYPNDYPIVLADGPGQQFSCFLSDYPLYIKVNGEQRAVVCVDIGPPGMDA